MSPDIAMPAPLLGLDEPPPCEVVNAGGSAHAVIVCDHASNRVPRRLASLGLPQSALDDHIGWDPGAAAVARLLARDLDAPLVLSGYSRLVIDCNRPLDGGDSIPPASAGVPIPGNRALSGSEREERVQALFRPYHEAIAAVLDARAAAGRPSLLLSIHSFTPVLAGCRRPWDIGFAWGRDARLARRLIDAMAVDAMPDETQLVIGANQPYTVADVSDHTIPVHGEARHLPCVLVEIRQDLLRNVGDAEAWARRLAEAYRRAEPSFTQPFAGEPRPSRP